MSSPWPACVSGCVPERVLLGKAELSLVADNAGVATFYHVTPTANRESIGQHGLDWYHGGGGIAGSLIPEQQGVFLARDMHEAAFFVRMGSRRFAALDIWEVTLEDEPSGNLKDPDELGREFDGYLCWMRAIPPAQLRLVKRDIPGDPDPRMPDLRPIAQIEQDLRAEGWADHTSLARQLTVWDRLGHGVSSYSMTVDDYTNDLCSRDYMEIAIGRLPSYLSGWFSHRVAATDQVFRDGTKDDGDGALARYFRIQSEAGWWWRRIPAAEPLAEYLAASGRL